MGIVFVFKLMKKMILENGIVLGGEESRLVW